MVYHLICVSNSQNYLKIYLFIQYSLRKLVMVKNALKKEKDEKSISGNKEF